MELNAGQVLNPHFDYWHLLKRSSQPYSNLSTRAFRVLRPSHLIRQIRVAMHREESNFLH